MDTQHLLRNKGQLKNLPVPDLRQSAEKYLTSVKPYQTEAEHAKTRALWEEFCKPGGDGERLQKKLQERANQKENWLIEWWNDVAYLYDRSQILINTTPTFCFEDDPFPTTQLDRATRVVLAALEWERSVYSKEFKQDMLGGKPLCMEQYLWLFSTNRVPRQQKDYISVYPESRHIVALKNGNFYRIDVVDSNNELISRDELERRIHSVISDDHFDGPKMGILSTENRDVWAKCRHILEKDDISRETLRHIDTAKLVLNLDESSPKNIDEAMRGANHGLGADVYNRWYDKCLQFIIFKNGKAGLAMEHSCADGPPTARLVDYIIPRSRTLAAQRPPRNPSSATDYALNRLRWNAPNTVLSVIPTAKSHCDDLIADTQVKMGTYPAFGAYWIKTNKMSPDAFIQIAIQLAQYSMSGKLVGTYESSSTRPFIQGRTEVTRGVSLESKRFVEGVMRGQPSEKDLRAAVNSHQGRMKEATTGNAFDRHFLGLRLIAGEEGSKHAVFEDPVFSYSGTWRMSTSQISFSNHTSRPMFGPVCYDGHGCCYSVMPNLIMASCSSKEGCQSTSAHVFAARLEWALLTMRDIIVKNKREADIKAKL